MKKAIAIIIPTLLAIIVLGGYFFGVFYYRAWFCPNTYINGVKVSGQPYSFAENIVGSELVINNISINKSTGEELFIPGDEIYVYDANDALYAYKSIIDSENPFLWPYYLFNKHEYVYRTEIRLDEDKLKSIVEDSFFASEEKYDEDNSAEIKYTKEDGYVLIDHTNNLLDYDLLIEDIRELALNNGGSITVDDEKYYKDVNHNKEYEEVVKEWKKLEKVIGFEMEYKLASGESVMIDSSVMSEMIAKDEKGNLLEDEEGNYFIDSEKVYEFVENMSEEYDNFYKPKFFKATRGDVVEIPYSRYTTYGNLMNIEEEAKALEELMVKGRAPKTREPIYIQTEYAGSFADNYGGTYVEIDLTNQTMYYYLDNELQLETPIVTGCWSNGNMTPSAVCYIVNKARNIWLDGPTWHSFVYHWMCITGQIGIHDSTWRSSYGGEIYKYGGSHGCINTPMDAVDELFNTVEIGTPVLVFE